MKVLCQLPNDGKYYWVNQETNERVEGPIHNQVYTVFRKLNNNQYWLQEFIKHSYSTKYFIPIDGHRAPVLDYHKPKPSCPPVIVGPMGI